MKTLNKTFLSALVLSVCSLSTAMAAPAVYQTRQIDSGVNSSDYKASWNAQTSTITTQNLADFNGAVILDGSNWVYGGFSHLKIDFSTPVAGATWNFRLAPDAGLGGAIYLDGQQIDTKTYDLWWGGDWNANSQIFSGSQLLAAAGNHSFEGYWAEACCNGGQGVQ
jgi:hypothetical protein